jgi:hypothetical protein
VGDAADEVVVELEEREGELCELSVVEFEEAVGVGVWDPEEELDDVTPEAVDTLDAVVEDDEEIVVELEGGAMLGDM